MSSDWKTAAEWAAQNLEGLPSTKRRINAMAGREEWQLLGETKARKANRPGGGWEYNLSCLPKAAQADYRRRVTANAQQEQRAQELATREGRVGKTLARVASDQSAVAQSIDARRRQIMEARATIVLELERRAFQCGNFSKAVAEFLSEAHAGLLQEPIASTVKRAMDKGRGLTPSRPTLYNWRKALNDAGGDAKALVPQKRVQETKGNLDDLYPWFSLFLRFYALPQKPTIQRAVEKTIEALSDAQRAAWEGNAEAKLPCRLPSYPKARRVLKSLAGGSGHLLAFKGREGPLALKARMSFKRRTFEDMDPTTVYTADGKTFDAEVAHPIQGKPFKPEITTILDAVTRKCVGVSLGLAENAQEVADALRRACEGHGIPAIFYTDNGSGYKNQRLDDASLGLCARLGITSTNSIAYNSQARGIIERSNATLWNTLAKEFPTYMGADMDREAQMFTHKVTRAEIKKFGQSAMLPSWEEFTQAVARTVEAYNDRPHAGLRIRDAVTGRMRKASPNEAWADFEARGFEVMPILASEADDLFRPYEERVCNRGEVTIFNNKYSAPELEPFNGITVLVGYDPFDASRVWVRERAELDGHMVPGRLLCVASFFHNKERYYPVSATDAAMERRNKAALARQDVKRARTLEELRPAVMLEHAKSVPLPKVKPSVPEIVENSGGPTQPSADILEMPKPARRKPRFADDYELADHCIQHPEEMDTNQRRLLLRMFNNPSARELFVLKGGRVDDLKNLLTSTTPQHPDQRSSNT